MRENISNLISIAVTSTVIPLENETENIKKPFIEKGLTISDYVYFGESVLEPQFRGQGIGKKILSCVKTGLINCRMLHGLCFARSYALKKSILSRQIIHHLTHFGSNKAFKNGQA